MPAEPGGPPLAPFQPELATPAWRRRLKATEPGRLVAALYRRRRLPVQLLRAPRAAGPATPPGSAQRVRAVIWVPAGQGAMPGLLEAWRSMAASSPGEVALLVTDDWTTDAHAAAVTAEVPDAVVVRTRRPTGGPPRLWPATTLAIRTALARFDFDLLLKVDSDAVAVGPDAIGAITAAIAAAQRRAPVAGDGDAGVPIGIAGAFVERPDGGVETDADYHLRVLADERPHDARLGAWADRARAAGWPSGAMVQGGVLVLTRACCEAMDRTGALAYRQRLRALVSEDLLLTILAYATGFRAASLGGPSGPLAVANKHLPLPLDDLLAASSPWKVIHSTKVGLAGEPEAEILRRARAARATWATAEQTPRRAAAG